MKGLSEPSRTTAQPSGAVAISAPGVATAARGAWAVIDLIVYAAVVGTNEMTVVIAAMVLMPARQQRHRSPTVGELLDGRRILPPGAPVSRRTCRRHRDEQRRHPNQCLHPAISIGWHSGTRFDGTAREKSQTSFQEDLQGRPLWSPHCRPTRSPGRPQGSPYRGPRWRTCGGPHHSAATPNGSSRPWNSSDSPAAGIASSCSRTRNHNA
jgi:hypothetical protein